VKPGGEGVIEAGMSRGAGRYAVKTWIATFPVLKIGEEEVRNARLHVGDIGPLTDMLLGADFFLSHRIYVASSQTQVYFTYNGGPVFKLEPPHAAVAAASGMSAVPESPGSAEAIPPVAAGSTGAGTASPALR